MHVRGCMGGCLREGAVMCKSEAAEGGLGMHIPLSVKREGAADMCVLANIQPDAPQHHLCYTFHH